MFICMRPVAYIVLPKAYLNLIQITHKDTYGVCFLMKKTTLKAFQQKSRETVLKNRTKALNANELFLCKPLKQILIGKYEVGYQGC